MGKLKKSNKLKTIESNITIQKQSQIDEQENINNVWIVEQGNKISLFTTTNQPNTYNLVVKLDTMFVNYIYFQTNARFY